MGCKQSKVANPIPNDKGPQNIHETIIEIEEVRTEVIPESDIINIVSELTTITEELIEPQRMVGQVSKIDQDRITREVHEALVTFLPDYNVDPFKDKFGNRLFYSPSVGVMEVARKPNISLNPDLNGKVLRHSIIPTNYILHASFEKQDPSKVKFLYQLITPKQFVTSPYYTGPDSSVPCSYVSIEEALNEEHPVAGIVKVLGRILSNNTGNNGFDGIDFLWDMSGPEDNFTISKNKVYWEDVAGDEGEVKTTAVVTKQLRLRLIELTSS